MKIQASELTSLFTEGLASHRAGRLADAEKAYRRILALQPDHSDSLHLLGVIFHQRGNHAEAVDLIDLALKKNPRNFVALNNRALALNALNRCEEALENFDRVLALQPNHAEALYNRGNALYELGRFEESLASYDRAIALRPNYAEALYNRGNALRTLRRFEKALASYDRAIALRGNHAESFSNRGLTLHGMKRFEEALVAFDGALAMRPNYPKALCNRGVTLHELKRFEEAIASYNGALAVQPNFPDALYNRGVTLHELKRFEEALASYDRAIAVRPNYAEAFSNRGLCLHELGRVEEALGSHDHAIAIRPDYAEPHSCRGVILHEMGRFDEALTNYDRATTIRPDFAEAHYNAALGRLLAGDFERGWEEREWRWQTEQAPRWNFPQPVWRGSIDIAGKSILLHAEQGYGDMIQFCRYAPLVAERGATVILEVPEPLHGLMNSLRGIARIVRRGEPLPHFDLHCPLLSLPLAFGTRLETIPSATPYLTVSSTSVSRWKIPLGPKDRPRIGLIWSGHPSHKNDHNRSMRFSALSPLLDCDASFVSLQKDVRAADMTALTAQSNLLHFGDTLKNFSDTAALISNLDLVISVDTGVAHLAGALGRPVWVMVPFIPDWRWLLGREDSPWYPTARLFRQDETRGWDVVILRVHAALREFLRAF